MGQKKFGIFGVTFYPKGAQRISWLNLSATEISAQLEELRFPAPLELGSFLTKVSIRGDKKKNGKGYYFSKLEYFTGQLELGSKNGKPHYQLCVEVKPKITKSKLLKYLSRELYGESKSSAISIIELTEDSDAYEDYCKKENRANLPGKYEHVIIDSTVSFFVKYVEENPQLKKFLKHPILIKNG